MSGLTSSPTIADVAREASVSISTVSRFLNGSTLLAEETITKVRDAVQRLGYMPRSAARNLALRRTNTLGVLIESIGSSFSSSVVAGAEEEAMAEGYSLLISTPGHLFHGGLPALGPFNTDGLLIVNVAMKRSMFSFNQDGYPMICLYQPAPRSMKIPLVSIENKRGAFLIVEHLIQDHGITRIGYLRGPRGNHDSYWREVGYRQALKKYRLPVDERLVGFGNFSYPSSRKTVLDWYRLGIIPQAIFAGNDDSAMDVVLTLTRLGLRVPQDVAVVGFDDSHLALCVVPPLTTIRAPMREVGREGVRRVLRLIRTGSCDLRTLLPVEMVLRGSCGCVDQVDPDIWPDISNTAPADAPGVEIPV
jgi:DNA-binding LacI/PurR family transcriptional regulator